jgi:outer membrane protein OmpA-like peptidoglycan-associated protein
MDNSRSQATDHDTSLDSVRKLVVAADSQAVKQALQNNAREVVSKVISEALHDRELSDGSVNKALVPLVEKSVEQSIANNRENFVSALYPLVGSLVRRAVSSFLNDFIERANTLLESSLTPKGITWRFRAWHAGISYSAYVASQIYQYQIEQILLIHSKTGLLLQSIALDPSRDKDASLVSAMLTALNDFTADTFKHSGQDADNQIHEIKTQNATLLVKIGPQAILAAAITGKVPSDVKNKLQQALEDIHRLYQQELVNFDGDSSPFNPSQVILRDCLIRDKRKPDDPQRPRYLGWTTVVAILLVIGWLSYGQITHKLRLAELRNMTPPAGIVVTQIDSQANDIRVNILRDSAAPTVADWFAQEGLSLQGIKINETPIVIPLIALLEQRIQQLVAQYPLLTFDPASFAISGQLDTDDYPVFLSKLNALPGIEKQPVTNVAIELIPQASNTAPLSQERTLMLQYFSQINTQYINFSIASVDINQSEASKITFIAELFNASQHLAQELGLTASLMILGTSDTSGNATTNLTLSNARAQKIKALLVAAGIQEEYLVALGIGELILTDSLPTRRVIFNIIYSPSQNREPSL